MRAVMKIGVYSRIFPSFSWGIFTHVTRLDQWRERKYLMDYKRRHAHPNVTLPRKEPLWNPGRIHDGTKNVQETHEGHPSY